MSLFRLVKQHRAESAQTEVGRIKEANRIKRFRVLRFILIFVLVVFAIMVLIALLNNIFHWWTVLPWPKEGEVSSSAPELSSAERIFFGTETR